MKIRPRRNRKSENLRALVRETQVSVKDLVWPVFIAEGQKQKIEIKSLPGCYRFSLDLLLKQAERAAELGIPGLALFPAISDAKKDRLAKESYNSQGLMQKTIKELKKELPDLVLFSDVAMDPYSSDGHDGLVEDGKIVNDPTLEILARMAISQAEAGVDFVAPSDMMDGRVGFIRKTLDHAGFSDVGIMSYAAKYASSFYGPFREALKSAPKSGDKKTYQMDPANQKEALREVKLDLSEGADIVMVKPALSYLDVISKVKTISTVPVAAYNVSGEYAMIKAAAQMGWLNENAAVDEMILSIKRAGADIIFTYFALALAERWR